MTGSSANEGKLPPAGPSGQPAIPSKDQVRERIPVLLAQHDEMEELFLLHQEALLDRDLERARQLLIQYRELVQTHIEEENLQLLPIYAGLGEAPLGGNVELFHSEHEKILARLDQLDETMADLFARTPLVTKDLIATFDRESSFKHLMEHHDLRERRFFFPALERWSTNG
jgi:hypothetical protein